MDISAFWIILTGALVASAAGLLGTYLILRKMAMVGDAISHAVLPGIVAAFMLTGSRDSSVMLIGAAVVGLLTTFLIEFFHSKARLQSDASIGVSFTFFFAVGIVLVSQFGAHVDLDADCVLYGEIAYVPLDLIYTDTGHLGPKAVWVLGAALLVVLLLIRLGRRELFLTTFDPSYAATIGISTVLWHYLLMGVVSLTTVASFESVGAILVVAFLTVPPATAYLLTNSFRQMQWITVGLAVVLSAAGYYLAAWWDVSITGAMATLSGVVFMLAFFFSPLQRGRFWKVKPAKPEVA